MRPKELVEAKSGDLITVRMWNALVRAIRRCDINVGQSTGLSIQQTHDGTILRIIPPDDTKLAIANGNIPARAGADAGIGLVHIVYAAPTYSAGALTGVILSTGTPSIQVYNPSSAQMTSGNGIDSGQYCWIREYPTGLWVVWPLECS